ncbi:MAG: ferrous iron transport protein A [Tissierellia bacterium]|nr:ferrous iron transport protein A [Tissierellia bacterium]
MTNKTLSDLHPNQECKIHSIYGGRNVNKRLYELGLNKGAKVKVLKNDVGPIILSLSGNKLALGRGLADKISVV